MKDNRYCLQVHLRQHTPLMVSLDEKGIYLRSTEMKPALVRFLLTNHKTYLKKNLKNCILEASKEGEKDSLDFAIRNFEYQREDKFDDKKKWINSPIILYDFEEVTFEIHSRKVGLLSFIEEHLAAFFICHNFGRAKSKGYGQFTVFGDVKSESETENIIRKYLEPDQDALFKGQIKKRPGSFSNNDVKDFPLTIFRDQYQKLKSGSNFIIHPKNGQPRKIYAKSLLWEYIDKHKKQSWEKREIKKQLKLKCKRIYENLYRETKQYSTDKASDNYFFRSLLGMAENFEFNMQDNRGRRIKNKLKVKTSHDDIDQFPSGIQVKIFEEIFYIVPLQIGELLSKKFKFTADLKELNEYYNFNYDNFECEIETPSKFSLTDMLLAEVQPFKKPLQEIYKHLQLKKI